ncbi:MAG: redox-regulated ATPase YchF [Candidatus Micrarchaeia archaeon]
MLVGIVGAPNKGKSTLFSALTMHEVEIADYPFTTINPNLGVAYVSKECVDKELNISCNARNSLCINHVRFFPVNIIDVAGLVEDAHLGKGMGNQFLNDLASADALIVVVDASGKTDAHGNKVDYADPINDVNMVTNEIIEWISGIIKKHINIISKREDGVEALYEVLSAFKVTKKDIESILNLYSLSSSKINWTDDEIKKFSEGVFKKTKPMVVAANKIDAHGAIENLNKLKNEIKDYKVIGCSASIELALRKAAKQKIIEYTPGVNSFKIIEKDLSKEKLDALLYIQNFLKSNGSNIQQLLNYVVFDLLDNIVVYPVEDENKYTDHFGNILPDGILIKRGSTALNLAEKIHTNLAKGMLYAIDARTKKRLSKDYILKDNDIIKIVSTIK